jgi:hypothetical protein
VIWRLFRRTSPQPDEAAPWWRAADVAAGAPSADALDQLRSTMTAPDRSPDEAERQAEMIEGLEELVRLAGEPGLPVLVTQHRAVGADACHAVMPVTVGGSVGVPGKLFLTSRRLVVTGAGLSAWPWHRIRHVERQGRTLLVSPAGDEPSRILCNSYGDALAAAHLAARLRTSGER